MADGISTERNREKPRAGLHRRPLAFSSTILGEGGMGRVLQGAIDSRMGRDVAFKSHSQEKLKHPAAAGRFVQEMIALAAVIKHPNVVEVFTADQVGDNHFCVMEFIDGLRPDEKIVQDKGPLSVPRSVRHHPSSRPRFWNTPAKPGLVHRDIKPSNIIVPRNNTGTVKLVDLGLAHADEPRAAINARRITQEGFVIGTPDFSPRNRPATDVSRDIHEDIYSARRHAVLHPHRSRAFTENRNRNGKADPALHRTAAEPVGLPARMLTAGSWNKSFTGAWRRKRKRRPQKPSWN